MAETKEKKENSGKALKITQVRSMIGATASQKATIKALGLGRPRYESTHNDSPIVRGQIRAVKHLVKVEEVK